MSKKTNLVDTNLIIRFLTNDNKTQADKVENLLLTSQDSSLLIPDVIFIEIVYVLLSVYKLKKNEIIEKLNQLIDFPAFKLNQKILKSCLFQFSNNDISIEDAYLLALVNENPKLGCYSFDKKLQKVSAKKIQSL